MHCLLCHNKCSELDFEQDHLPGPKDRVTISCLQLHLRVPFAGFITGLLWVICKQNGGVTGTGTAVDKKTCVQSASSINTDLNEVAHIELLKGDPKRNDDVGSSLNLPLAALLTAAKAKEVIKGTSAAAKEAGERITTSTSFVLLQSFLATSIIDLPCVRIFQGLIGNSQVLEFFIGFRIIWVFVRVHFFRQFSVSFFDRICVRILPHAQNFVKISPAKKEGSSTCSRGKTETYPAKTSVERRRVTIRRTKP